MQFLRTAKVFLLGLSTVALVVGCAHPQFIDKGASAAQIAQKLGEPEAKTKMPDGTTRWTYSMQPFGQEVWWVFFDQKGKAISSVQGLKRDYFHLLTIGKSTEKDVWALWGTCAEKYTFHLIDEHAWMYRFKDIGGFDMAVWPQFDKNGILRSLDVTEDPWRRDCDFRLF